jgi:Protein of unknown function (DUF2911)
MTLARSILGLTLGALTVLSSVETIRAQDLHPSRRPSPVGIAKTHVGDTYVKVTYGRPYVRDRDIFGDPADGNTYLVPFGELWRTGANEATELTTTGAILVAGKRLASGTYSVFTVPGATTWTVRFNTQLGMDGTGRLDPVSGEFSESYDEAEDVLTVEVPSTTLSEDVDQFTIAFEPALDPTHLVLSWARTAVRIPVAGSGH